jgi:hypothetical protein
MNSANPKPKWVRLIVVIGILCAAVAYCSYFLQFRFNNNGSDARLYDKAVAPLALITWLGIFICGISLLKHCKIIGQILILLGILLFVLSLLTPAL